MNELAEAIQNLHVALVALNRAICALKKIGLNGEARSITRHCERVRSQYLILMSKEDK